MPMHSVGNNIACCLDQYAVTFEREQRRQNLAATRRCNFDAAVNALRGVATFQIEVIWPEAQEFRKMLGLPEKKFHVSLNGGIGDAARTRNRIAAKSTEHL
jgi:hypothetical protein